jgi:hypothetical protein
MVTDESRRVFRVFAAALLIGYGALLIAHVGHGVGGCDSSGYANTARGILSGRIVQPIGALDRLALPDSFHRVFMPLAYEPGPRPRTMAPLYPPGFPLHIALAVLVDGWNAGPFLVSPIAAIFCAVLMFLLGRELGLSRPLALAGAAILGGCPVLLYQAVQPMSDVVATAWAEAAVLFALRSRRGDAWAAAAGAALGIAILVRPTNVMLVLPMAFALRWRPRTVLLLALGGLPFAGFFAMWNRTAYGGAIHTGYAGIFGSELDLANFPPRVHHYGHWLIAQLSPLVPLGWLAAAANRRIRGRDRALLLFWFAPSFLFYCFWGPYDAWWYTRYLLPGLPALILGFLLVLRDLTGLLPQPGAAQPGRRLSYPVLATAAVLLTVAVFERRIERRFRPLGASQGQVIFPDACRELAARTMGGKALVVSMEFSGALRFYADLTPVRWDWINPDEFALLRVRAAERGERIFALLLPHEVEPARPKVPGLWKSLGNVRQASLWELPPGP